MGFLELARSVLILGVALLECVGMIGEAAGAVDVAKATPAEAGIGAPIGKAVVAKARSTAGEAAAVKPSKASAVEATEASAAESAATEAAAGGVLGPDREADGERSPCQQRAD
jgi:hypothetical protein